MEDLKYKYFIFKGMNDLEYVLIDRQKGKIYTLKNGEYEDQTKICREIYWRDKEKNWENIRMGFYYEECLRSGKKSGFISDIVLESNDLEKFNFKSTKIRLNQVNMRLKNMKHYIHFKDENEREEYKKHMLSIKKEIIEELSNLESKIINEEETEELEEEQ